MDAFAPAATEARPDPELGRWVAPAAPWTRTHASLLGVLAPTGTPARPTQKLTESVEFRA